MILSKRFDEELQKYQTFLFCIVRREADMFRNIKIHRRQGRKVDTCDTLDEKLGQTYFIFGKYHILWQKLINGIKAESNFKYVERIPLL